MKHEVEWGGGEQGVWLSGVEAGVELGSMPASGLPQGCIGFEGCGVWG